MTDEQTTTPEEKIEDVQKPEEVASSEVDDETGTQDLPPVIMVFIPKAVNINYHGERVFQLGAMCYGVICRKSDNKVLITYNINPENLHPDHFDRISITDVPKSIYKMFQKKLSSDIQWIDTTMMNMIKNKWALNTLFNFAEENKNLWTDEIPEAAEYSEQDAIADKKIRDQITTTNRLPRQTKNKQRQNQKKARKKQRK